MSIAVDMFAFEIMFNKHISVKHYRRYYTFVLKRKMYSITKRLITMA